jgi:polyisoprenoid-binding protein YceI
MASSRARKWLWILTGAIALVVVAVVAVPFVYIHFIEPDPAPRLTLSTPSSTKVAGVARVPLAGTWSAGSASKAQYRVNEVLFGQNNTATGSTSAVTGNVTIAGTTVTATDITVDLTTVKSNEDRRDSQFQGRIMNTAQFPHATFKLTQPIALGSQPKDGTPITVPATGDLTLHGATKSVTVNLKAQRSGNTIEVQGTIPVVFADYGIPNPSFTSITTDDHGELEFLLELSHA